MPPSCCAALAAQLGGGEIPRAPPGRGRFTVSDDDALQELQATHRRRNQQTFESRCLAEDIIATC